MIPSVGRIVHYQLGEYDIKHLGERLGRMSNINAPKEGETYPMLIVRVWAEEPTETTSVNGRVFLDGQHDLWVTSRQQGDGPGKWSDPLGAVQNLFGELKTMPGLATKDDLDELRGKIDALVTAAETKPDANPESEQAAE